MGEGQGLSLGNDLLQNDFWDLGACNVHPTNPTSYTGLAIEALSREAHKRDDALPKMPDHSPNSNRKVADTIDFSPITLHDVEASLPMETMAQVINSNGKRLI